jgi:hypothetical protein
LHGSLALLLLFLFPSYSVFLSLFHALCCNSCYDLTQFARRFENYLLAINVAIILKLINGTSRPTAVTKYFYRFSRYFDKADTYIYIYIHLSFIITSDFIIPPSYKNNISNYVLHYSSLISLDKITFSKANIYTRLFCE